MSTTDTYRADAGNGAVGVAKGDTNDNPGGTALFGAHFERFFGNDCMFGTRRSKGIQLDTGREEGEGRRGRVKVVEN